MNGNTIVRIPCRCIHLNILIKVYWEDYHRGFIIISLTTYIGCIIGKMLPFLVFYFLLENPLSLNLLELRTLDGFTIKF